MTRLERSYVHGAATTPLIGETIGMHLDRVAALSPDADAWSFAIRVSAGPIANSATK